jgi:hypothetical protein
MKTWAETGSQNVETDIDGNEKDCSTLKTTIAAAQTKLPLVMIASGKMGLSELGNLEKIPLITGLLEKSLQR